MCAMSSELHQYMTGLTNEISRGHFDKAVRLGEKALEMEELHSEGNESLLGEIYRNMAAASEFREYLYFIKFSTFIGYFIFTINIPFFNKKNI